MFEVKFLTKLIKIKISTKSNNNHYINHEIFDSAFTYIIGVNICFYEFDKKKEFGLRQNYNDLQFLTEEYILTFTSQNYN